MWVATRPTSGLERDNHTNPKGAISHSLSEIGVRSYIAHQIYHHNIARREQQLQ